MKARRLTTLAAVVAGVTTAASSCSTTLWPGEAKPVEVVLPDALTAPGSRVAVGETLRVPGEASTEGDVSPGWQPVELGLTVTDVSWPGEALFDDYDNGDDFAGDDPVVVAYQLDSPAGEDRFDFQVGDVYGILSGGGYAEQLQGDYGFETGGIGRDLDEVCYPGGVPEPDTTELRCTVLLVPDGQTLTSLGWNALGFDESNNFAADDPRYPYVSAPVLVEVTKP